MEVLPNYPDSRQALPALMRARVASRVGCYKGHEMKNHRREEQAQTTNQGGQALPAMSADKNQKRNVSLVIQRSSYPPQSGAQESAKNTKGTGEQSRSDTSTNQDGQALPAMNTEKKQTRHSAVSTSDVADVSSASRGRHSLPHRNAQCQALPAERELAASLRVRRNTHEERVMESVSFVSCVFLFDNSARLLGRRRPRCFPIVVRGLW